MVKTYVFVSENGEPEKVTRAPGGEYIVKRTPLMFAGGRSHHGIVMGQQAVERRDPRAGRIVSQPVARAMATRAQRPKMTKEERAARYGIAKAPIVELRDGSVHERKSVIRQRLTDVINREVATKLDLEYDELSGDMESPILQVPLTFRDDMVRLRDGVKRYLIENPGIFRTRMMAMPEYAAFLSNKYEATKLDEEQRAHERGYDDDVPDDWVNTVIAPTLPPPTRLVDLVVSNPAVLPKRLTVVCGRAKLSMPNPDYVAAVVPPQKPATQPVAHASYAAAAGAGSVCPQATRTVVRAPRKRLGRAERARVAGLPVVRRTRPGRLERQASKAIRDMSPGGVVKIGAMIRTPFSCAMNAPPITTITRELCAEEMFGHFSDGASDSGDSDSDDGLTWNVVPLSEEQHDPIGYNRDIETLRVVDPGIPLVSVRPACIPHDLHAARAMTTSLSWGISAITVGQRFEAMPLSSPSVARRIPMVMRTMPPVIAPRRVVLSVSAGTSHERGYVPAYRRQPMSFIGRLLAYVRKRVAGVLRCAFTVVGWLSQLATRASGVLATLRETHLGAWLEECWVTYGEISIPDPGPDETDAITETLLKVIGSTTRTTGEARERAIAVVVNEVGRRMAIDGVAADKMVYRAHIISIVGDRRLRRRIALAEWKQRCKSWVHNLMVTAVASLTVGAICAWCAPHVVGYLLRNRKFIDDAMAIICEAYKRAAVSVVAAAIIVAVKSPFI